MKDDIKIVHAGLAASSEEKADRFFSGILGLEKTERKTLDKNLSQALFGISHELLVIHYKAAAAHYEIFVHQEYKAPEKQIAHSCIQLADLANIVKKCRDAGVKVVEVPKGPAVVTFVSDHDGNLFELKQQPAS